MKEMIKVTDYDNTEDSNHFDPEPTWGNDVEASRKFRTLESGDAYSYRNKVKLNFILILLLESLTQSHALCLILSQVLMGMSQTRVLNEPPSTTPPEDVMFDVPEDVALPDTDEGIMMLSVLEMQSLLRSGKLTSVELTMKALDMLKKYDPEYNMLEVALEDLAMEIAAKADAKFTAGEFVSVIQGIPFAVKDTYDVAGYATVYGSWEFLDNVVETESPLVTYAVNNLGVPLFKSTVPQLTWGYANYNGTVYSCLALTFSARYGG